MKVRKPTMDYSEVPLYWSDNHEFAQRWNAGSFVPAYIEPFLVKVLNEAKPLLDTRNKQLARDVEIFIKQEMEHCKQHVKFNRRFWSFGYDELKPLETAFAKDYDDWMKTKSLRFRLAYCEGFEAMSAISVTAIFEESDEFFETADQNVVDLWKWHLAEEYEHRCVMYDVFHQLYCKNPVTGYFWRIYGLLYAMVHLGGFTAKASKVLLDKDRSTMTPDQLAQSLENEKRAKKALGRPALKHLLEILSPFYRPARRRPPRGVDAYLGEGFPRVSVTNSAAVVASA
ncbi:metal-dependent hydrolase [Novosphingobium cyanobacteriorum]|uniref:Metal-dependent hydrolase n=1 Tax=Novosphingobium cyanobacteriorum TaxID=3024215 RepID=A0ABT6CKX8_9SPHN|nr:metal-dependent hydrolase [Novosphingobium cyanobacteriorum]MDF8334581.1 metal-dependent hydrolase [Novosphingobium cyanobacteriorum]